MSALPKTIMDIPAPPRPPISPAQIRELARRRATAAERLQTLAVSARQFAIDRAAWARAIAIFWPKVGGGTPVAGQQVLEHLSNLERAQERDLYPLLWILEDQRAQVQLRFSPAERAAWLCVIDPIIQGIREPIDVLRATKLKIQQKISEGADDADQKALIGYKIIAEEVFKTKCVVHTEEIDGQTFGVIDVPVSDPALSYKDKENRVHSTIEALAPPEYVGRVVLRYVPQRGAA